MPFSTIELVLRGMLSKAQNKHIRSLTQQKFRDVHRQFVAEGVKVAEEWLKSVRKVVSIVASQQWISENAALVKLHPEATVYEATDSDMESISQLSSPPPVLLVLAIPEPADGLSISGWCIALDGIQDPGNLGTIIRIADWFGIDTVICSEDCADAFNHKVVQAAMGSHLRVRVQKTDLENALRSADVPVYAATLAGASAYAFGECSPGVLLIGSEGRGISQSLLNLPVTPVTIPRIGGAESLNAAVSTGILCSWLVPR